MPLASTLVLDIADPSKFKFKFAGKVAPLVIVKLPGTFSVVKDDAFKADVASWL